MQLNELSILFMRFMYHHLIIPTYLTLFQFSLWDSSWGNGDGRRVWPFNFQFSLWDSEEALEKLYHCPMCDFQFSLWDSTCVAQGYLSAEIAFNSLYEIRGSFRTTTCKVAHSTTFNSLYEIPSMFLILWLIPLVSFQFSLWDSYENNDW